MKYFIPALAALFLHSALSAQVSYGGEPRHWADKHLPEHIPFYTTATPDKALLAAEDAVTDMYKEAPYRFGVEYEVQLSTENAGNWIIDSQSSEAIWQLGIECPEATSISLFFSTFDVPKGGSVYIWTEDRSRFLGKFDHRSVKESGVLATGILHDDRVVVEYHIPLELQDGDDLVIGKIVYGYRDILVSHFSEASEDRGPFGNSGACNINVNCPEGDDWQIEKRSVALIVEGGWALCSGSLVNNTAQDGTPYFLTANHCLGGSVSGWVFYFNHESATCSGSNGPTNQSVSGAVLRASNAASDFALLELDDVPPADFNVQYAGWDNSDDENAVTSVTGIHHPSGDVKKICFEEDAPYHNFTQGAEVWYIDQWEDGVTEGGSSGSPLFNQDHRIIGQLYGGFAACSGTVNNGLADWYGRFGVSWDGSSASTRLRDWLDPLNLNVDVLDGYPEGFVAAQYDAGVNQIQGVEATVCGSQVTPSVRLRNFGQTTLTSCTIHYQLNGGAEQTIGWTGSLAQNAQEMVSLPTLTLADGANSLTAWVTDPNGQTDQNANNDEISIDFTAFTGPVFEATLDITLDNYPEETSWELTQNNTVIYSSNGTYANQANGAQLTIPLCLPEGCYTFTMFDSFGDGICCDWGIGGFEILNQNNVVVGSGGQFSDEVNVDFCLNANSIEESIAASFTMYPNPASEQVRVDKAKALQTIEVMDMTGRVVRSLTSADASVVVDLQGLAAGSYQLRVRGEGVSFSRPLIVR